MGLLFCRNVYTADSYLRDPLGDKGYIKSSIIAKKIFLVIITVYVGFISSSCDHNFVP